VQRRENIIDIGLLEFCVREDLNKIAQRRMAVLDPVKLVITNYADGSVEYLDSENNPEAEDQGGIRRIPFSRELWIEREDFMEVPAKKWFRLAPGATVRLKSAYIVRCDAFTKDAEGNITEIQCSYIPESRSGNDTSGIHVKGTIHWVSVAHAVAAEVRLYDRLFRVEDPSAEGNFKEFINPDSLQIVSQAWLEPALAQAKPGEYFQFIRKGYFSIDPVLSDADKVIFNRTVTLKDAWAKEAKKGS
jgi:glutaminyl-tRNA synthetase